MKTSQVTGNGVSAAAAPGGTAKREAAGRSAFGRVLEGASRPGREARGGGADGAAGAPGAGRLREGAEGEVRGELLGARARSRVEREDDGRGGGDGRGGRRGEGRAETDREVLAPFVPPPPALVAPPSASAPIAVPVPGSAAERAEVAALVDRLVTSMRVGRVGRDGHEVHLRLGSGLEVRLRHERGELRAEVRSERGSREEAERIAGAFEREMRARGVSVDSVDVA